MKTMHGVAWIRGLLVLLAPVLAVPVEANGSGLADSDPLSGNNFEIATSSRIEAFPDIAYSPAIDRYLIVYEEADSKSSQGDIRGLFRAPDGSSTISFAIEGSIDSSRRPRVAWGTGGQFLVVWERASSMIKGAFVTWNPASPSEPTVSLTPFQISPNTPTICRRPDVGYVVSHQRYVIVMEMIDSLTSTASQLRAYSVDADGSNKWQSDALAVDSCIDTDPTISPRGQERLAVVWGKQWGNGDWDLQGCSVGLDTASTKVSTSEPQFIGPLASVSDNRPNLGGDSESNSLLIFSRKESSNPWGYAVKRITPNESGLTLGKTSLNVGSNDLTDVQCAAAMVDGKGYFLAAYVNQASGKVLGTTYATNTDPSAPLESLDLANAGWTPAAAICPSRKEALVCFQYGGNIYGQTVNLVPLDTEAPSKPGNFSASTLSSSEILLGWAKSTDNLAVAGYKVMRDGTVIATVNATSFKDEGLAAGTSYAYAVAAFDYSDNLSDPAEVAVSTPTLPDTAPPTAPTNLTAASPVIGTVSLTWSASTDDVGVVGYEILRLQDGQFVGVGDSLGTDWSESGLVASTQYQYQVRAVDAAGKLSPPSDVATIVMAPSGDTTAPTVPDALTATATAEGGISLTWQPSTDDGSAGLFYKIERSVDGVAFGGIATTSDSSYSDSSLSPGCVFWYRLFAVDVAGNKSDYSIIASATTAAPASQDPERSEEGDRGIGGGGSCGLVGMDMLLGLGLLWLLRRRRKF